MWTRSLRARADGGEDPRADNRVRDRLELESPYLKVFVSPGTKLPTDRPNVFRTRRRYFEGGVEHALSEQSRQGRERKLSGEEEALLVAITCSHPPTGRGAGR